MTVLSEANLLRRQAEKAATYIQKLVQKDDLAAARSEMHCLGVLGQVVAMELVNRLTAAERDKLSKHLTAVIADGAPRIKYRKSLRAMAEFGEALESSTATVSRIAAR